MSVTDALQTAAIFGLAVIQLINVKAQNNLINVLESMMKSVKMQSEIMMNVVHSQQDMTSILRALRNRL